MALLPVVWLEGSSSSQNAKTSTPKARAPRNFARCTLGLAGFFFFALISIAYAQEPASSPPKQIRISFVPPPLDGTISLGVYDQGGKLVRVLQREAELDEFEIGNDALRTTWDGKNDAGETLPPGKYRVRGFAVGEIEVDGVGFFFNDFVRDSDGPRMAKINRIQVENEELKLNGDRALDGESIGPNEPSKTIDSDSGKDGTVWIIERQDTDPPHVEVKQFSKKHELLRKLNFASNDPQPTQIAAWKQEDRIALLQESEGMQSVRGLRLISTAREGEQAVSDWKVEFEKKIIAHKNFTVEDGKPVVAVGKQPAEKVSVKLMANPLKNEARDSIELAVGYDTEGSFLKTADGLPLQSISETPHLTRVVLSSRGENAVDVFQDDDAVVEQFRIAGLEQMMAFDCGDLELK